MKVRIEGDRVYGDFQGQYFPQDTLTVRRKSKADGDGAYVAITDGDRGQTFSVSLSKHNREELIKLLGGTI